MQYVESILKRFRFLGQKEAQEEKLPTLPGTERCIVLKHFRPSGWGDAIYLDRDQTTMFPISITHCAYVNGAIVFFEYDFAYPNKRRQVDVDEFLALHPYMRTNLLVVGADLPGATYENISRGYFHSILGKATKIALQEAGHQQVITDIEEHMAQQREKWRLEAEQTRLNQIEQKKQACKSQLFPLLIMIKAFLQEQKPNKNLTREQKKSIFLALTMAEAGGVELEYIHKWSGHSVEELKSYLDPESQIKIEI